MTLSFIFVLYGTLWFDFMVTPVKFVILVASTRIISVLFSSSLFIYLFVWGPEVLRPCHFTHSGQKTTCASQFSLPP